METINILFVDDEPALLELIELYFEDEIEAGVFHPFFCESAQDALNLLEHNDDLEISVVVTDINMPKMNGIEFAEKLRKFYPQIALYMMSAYGDQRTLDEIKHLDVKYYFNKPVDFDDLKNILIQKNVA